MVHTWPTLPLHARSAKCYLFIMIDWVRGSTSHQRNSVRRMLGVLCGALLSLSVIGQLLPCVHTSARGAVNESSSTMMEMQMGSPMDSQTNSQMEMPATGHSSELPHSHHDPVAPGCAQLMACGMVVQMAVGDPLPNATERTVALRPVGPTVHFSAADREVESPPPRS